MSRGRGGDAKARRDKRARMSFLSVVNYEINTATCGSTAQVFCMTITQQACTGDVTGHRRVTVSTRHGDNN